MNKILDKLNSIKSDKLLHFICGLIIAQISYITLNQCDLSSQSKILMSFGITTVIAILKEVYDVIRYKDISKLDYDDILATAFGGEVGILMFRLYESNL